MNELDMLKRVRSDVPGPDPLALARARERLISSPPVRRRYPRPLIAASIAVALTGGFLASDVVSRDGSPQPGVAADAGTFLADAAAQAVANPDAAVPAGKYLQVTTQRSYLYDFGPRKEYRATTVMVEDKWISPGSLGLYPQRTQLLAKVTFDSTEARRAAASLAPTLLSKPKPRMERVNCAGIGLGSGVDPKILQKQCTPSWSTPTPEFLARQPRDPDALLAALRKADPSQGGRQFPEDQLAFTRIGLALDSGIVPADLRAALYQAARRIPGIKLVDDVVTLDGRHGRAVGYTFNGQRSEIIIASNGQSIGSRLIEADGDVYTAVSFTSRVVSTHP